MLGLYVHIPFCGKICDYCDFFTIQAPERLHWEYLNLLSAEISRFAERHPGILSQVETLYIGGGTPSLLSLENLARLFEILKSAGVPLKRLKEASMEFNPESCDGEKVALAMDCGIDRISIGVQTFSEMLLNRIGRSHGSGVGEKVLDMLTGIAGLRVSADLMFNLPGQSLEQFLSDLDRMSDFPLGHISFYGLKVDPDSRLGKRIARGEEAVDEDLYGPMYMGGVELLAEKGFERYETSNFAKSGQESLHNLNYWKRGEYLAFGPGAHGFFEGVRYYAPEMYARWRTYVQSGCPAEMLNLDPIGLEEQAAEIIQLSLRTKYGLDLRELQKIGYEIPAGIVQKWIDKKYLLKNGYKLTLTGEGWLFMDSVVEDLFCRLLRSPVL